MKKFDYKNEFKQLFGKRMLIARKKAGLTQVEVAKRLGGGWRQPAIKDIERYGRTPVIDNMKQFSEMYNVSVDDLLYGEDNPYSIEDNDYGFDINYTFANKNIRDEKESEEFIKTKLAELDAKDKSVIADLTEAVALHRDPKTREKHFEDKKLQYDEILEDMKKK